MNLFLELYPLPEDALSIGKDYLCENGLDLISLRQRFQKYKDSAVYARLYSMRILEKKSTLGSVFKQDISSVFTGYAWTEGKTATKSFRFKSIQIRVDGALDE